MYRASKDIKSNDGSGSHIHRFRLEEKKYKLVKEDKYSKNKVYVPKALSKLPVDFTTLYPDVLDFELASNILTFSSTSTPTSTNITTSIPTNADAITVVETSGEAPITTSTTKTIHSTISTDGFLSNSAANEQYIFHASEYTFRGKNNVFGINGRPGFYFIPGALTGEEQRQWLCRSVTEYMHGRSNLTTAPDKGNVINSDVQAWTKHGLKRLRWATL
eukprot:Awhi_evm1s1875